MITEEQYKLMVLADNGIKHKDVAYGTFDPIKEYLCPYEYIDTTTTKGVEQRPYIYGLNDDGLNEKRRYEQLRDKHTKKAAKERTPKMRLNKVSIGEQIISAVIGGCIVAFITFLASRFF